MYNGIGLQTPRGSGTNGYIQTNKFFVKSKTGKVAHDTKGFEAEHGTAGITRKPNKDILEHDRKRQLHLKLVELEDKLSEQGYTDAEIAEKLEEARKTLEAAAAAEESGGPSAIVVSGSKYSDTQSHQVAARKEKQMETLRAALGIRNSEPNEESTEGVDDGPQNDQKNGIDDDSMWSEKHEHAFLDRDYSRKKHIVGDLKVGKDDNKENKKKERDRVDDSSDADDSRKHVKVIRKKHHKVQRESDDETDTNSDSDKVKKSKSSKKHKRSQKYDSDDSVSSEDSDSSYGKNRRKSNKTKVTKGRRYDTNSDDSTSGDSTSGDSTSGDDTDPKYVRKKNNKSSEKSRRRHDSDDSASSDGTDDIRGKKNNRNSEKFTKCKGHDSDRNSDDGTDSYHGNMKDKKRDLDRPTKSRTYNSDREISGSDEQSAHDKKKNNTSEKYKRGRRRGINSDYSLTHDDDTGKVVPEQEIVRYRKSHRRHNSDDDTDSKLDLSKDKSHYVKQHRHHDSVDDSDADGVIERKSNPVGKLRSQQKGSSKTQIGYCNLDDRWRSEDTHGIRSRFQSQDDEPKRENRNDRDFGGCGSHIRDDVDSKVGRYHGVGEDGDRRRRKDEEIQHVSRKSARGEEGERSRSHDDREDEGHRMEKRHRWDDKDHMQRKYERDDRLDDRYGQHGNFDEQQHGSRRRGRDGKEEHPSKRQDRDRQKDYSKHAKYSNSRSNERRYEDNKRNDDRS